MTAVANTLFLDILDAHGGVDRVHTHCSEQYLYFDEVGLLRRQDYDVDVAGKFRAAHLISEYIDVEGLMFATKRRVYLRREDGSLQMDDIPVTIDLSEFQLT